MLGVLAGAVRWPMVANRCAEDLVDVSFCGMEFATVCVVGDCVVVERVLGDAVVGLWERRLVGRMRWGLWVGLVQFVFLMVLVVSLVVWNWLSDLVSWRI